MRALGVFDWAAVIIVAFYVAVLWFFADSIFRIENWWSGRKWTKEHLDDLYGKGYEEVFREKKWIIFHNKRESIYILFHDKKYRGGVASIHPSTPMISPPNQYDDTGMPEKIKAMWRLLSL